MPTRTEILASLAILIDHAGQLPQQTRFEAVGAKLPEEPEPVDRMDYCAQAIFSGALPDAESLMFIAESFYEYIDAAGSITLDKAFKLRSVQKVGNPAAKRQRRNERMSMLFDMACARADDPTLSLEKAAEAVAPDPELVDTLMRDYRRRNCRAWESGIPPLPPDPPGE